MDTLDTLDTFAGDSKHDVSMQDAFAFGFGCFATGL